MLSWPQTNTARGPPSESFKSTFGGEGLWILFYIEFSFSLGTLDFLLMTSRINSAKRKVSVSKLNWSVSLMNTLPWNCLRYFIGDEICLNMRFHFSPQMDKPLSGYISFYFDDCVACCRELITRRKRYAFMTTNQYCTWASEWELQVNLWRWGFVDFILYRV